MNERKKVIYLLFDMSKYEADEMDTEVMNGGYNFELFINNIEGFFDFLMTILIFFVLLITFLPNHQHDLDSLFSGQVISGINLHTLKYDIGLKISKINKDSDWKDLKEKCLSSIFDPIQECNYFNNII